MSGEHGEPWRVDLDGYIVDRTGEDTGEIYLDKELKRAIACVNALNGVSTADIEAGAVTNLVKALEACIDALADPSNSAFNLYCLNGARAVIKPFEEIARD